MAYRITEQELAEKPTPCKCTKKSKIQKRIRQLERDQSGKGRKWTSRKENILAILKNRLTNG